MGELTDILLAISPIPVIGEKKMYKLCKDLKERHPRDAAAGARMAVYMCYGTAALFISAVYEATHFIPDVGGAFSLM